MSERVKLRFFTITVLLVVAIVLLFIANIALGSVKIPFAEVVNILLGNASEKISWEKIVLTTRLPQAITACMAGAGLAVGGLQMQTLFRNPLAGPSILGISSGASLGVAIVMMFTGTIGGITLAGIDNTFGNLATITAAFLGSVVILMFVLFLARQVKNNAMLLIIGIMVGYTSSALVGVLKLYGMHENVHSYVVWGLGDFSSVTWNQMTYFLPVVMAGLLFSLILVKPLNTLLLGENYARNLGLNIKRARLLIILCAGGLTAVITAFCGPIAFLGLAVPHIARLLFASSDHKVLTVAVIFTGVFLALACNLIARLPGVDGALPINAVTSMFGAPVVISIILKRRSLNSFN
ncbi:MAG: iron chelate uptake ABC transporter family permease subunit [Rhodothermaceae bacterium]